MFLITFILCSQVFLLELRRTTFANREESKEETCEVQSQVFVDKTLLIKEFFKMDKHHLLAVPQGFGKTTNMDMIRRFCEIQVDKDGYIVKRNETKYFKVFSNLYKKKNIPSFLDVYKDKEFFNGFFTQHPVIHLDFTSLGYKSWSEFKDSLVKIINDIFNHHKYLLNSGALSDKEKIKFRNFEFHVVCKELPPNKLMESLTYLATLLNKHFNKKIIILIDNIDSVLYNSIMRSSKGTEEIISFLKIVINKVLKSNITMKAVLNSSLRLAKVLVEDDKNIDHFTFTEKHPFNQFYGFTDNEVVNLVELFDMKSNLTTIRDWYNGYKITNSDLKMYGFDSVTNVLFKKDLDIYLTKGKHPKKFESLFLKRKVRRKVKSLIRNGVVKVKLFKKVSIKDVLRLKEIFKDPKSTEINANDEALIFYFMLDLGYVTVVNNQEYDSKLSLKVPNVETKSELMDMVYSKPYFKTKLNLTDKDILTLNETELDSRISKLLKEPVLPMSHSL